MAQVDSYDNHIKTILEEEDTESGQVASIVFTTKRGDKLYLEVNPAEDSISLFEADEDDECDPTALIKHFDIDVLENPNLDNDE